MALRILLFINEHVKDLGPPAWNNGIVTSQRQLLINRFSTEPGRNGTVYSDWVLAGSNEEWRWFDPDATGVPHPTRRFYPGGEIVSDTVVSIIEDTDYILSSLWEADLRGGAGDWALVGLMTDREYDPGQLAGYNLYDITDWD